jgi:MFS family permease
MYEAVLGPGRQTILFAGFTALVYFFGALIAATLVDRVGRRPLFMSGSIFMTIWLVLMAVFNKVSLGLTSAILVIVFTMIYVGTFGATWACVDWLCRHYFLFFFYHKKLLYCLNPTSIAFRPC